MKHFAKLYSKADRGGDEKPTQAYYQYVEERAEDTRKRGTGTTKVGR
jgi:hypothetical protein